ncbi:MAG: ADP-ribosylglycohydrolase family protein [Bacteroidota bacterium]
MLSGAIIGDIIGSRFEKDNHLSTEFPLFVPACRFTDDTVLTLAIAQAILTDGDYEKWVRKFALRYPLAGFGGTFKKWMLGLKKGPYNSWGNGSAMRVSPIGWAFDSIETVQEEASRSAAITHNHPEGIKGAQAIASGIFWARKGADKQRIQDQISTHFGYDLSQSLDEIRPNYRFDVSCQGSVPQAIIAFLESHDVESAIRLAISIGGDSDTIASMSAALAEAYYGYIQESMLTRMKTMLPGHLLETWHNFNTFFTQAE